MAAVSFKVMSDQGETTVLYYLPNTVEEVEELLEQFYGPNPTADYVKLDTILKAIQRSPNALTLADGLLDSENPKSRFFGASTFVVKINRDWDLLDPLTTNGILSRLLEKLVVAGTRDSALVINKLCVALISIFKRRNKWWTYCILHVVKCLLSPTQMGIFPTTDLDTDNYVCKLNETQMLCTLLFSTALIEEMSKIDSQSTIYHDIHNAAYENMGTILIILTRAMDSNAYHDEDNENDHDVGPKYTSRVFTESIKLLQSLVSYVHGDTHTKTPAVLREMRRLVFWVLEGFDREGQVQQAADFFIHVLDNESGFITADIAPAVSRQMAGSFYIHVENLVRGGFDEENLTCGRLVIQFGEAFLQIFVEDPDNVDVKTVTDMLRILTTAKGYAIEEDTLAQDLLEFWINYAQAALDGLPPSGHEEKPYWLVAATNNLYTAIEGFLKKVEFPPESVFKTWDRETQAEFHSFRRDFRDMCQTAYCIIDVAMFDQLFTHSERLWQEKNWYGLEAVLLSIRGCIDATGTSGSGYTFPARLFTNSPLIGALQQDAQEIPIVLRKAAMQVVSDCAYGFHDHAGPLKAALDLLFSCLEHPELREDAANNVARLCDVCRNTLETEAYVLTERCCEFLSRPGTTWQVKQKFIAGAAAVVQSLWVKRQDFASWMRAYNALNLLLELIATDLVKYIPSRPLPTNTMEETRQSLQCLVSIAKAFRGPEAEVVDLEGGPEGGDNGLAVDGLDASNAEDRVNKTRERISALTAAVIRVCPNDGEIMESICNIVRAGINEKRGNPFHWPPEYVDSLVKDYISQTPRTGYLLETASRYLRVSDGSWWAWTEKATQLATNCLHEALKMLESARQDVELDPEITSSVIDFAGSLIPLYPYVIFDGNALKALQSFFEISVTCLTLDNWTLKQSASNLWVKVFDFGPGDGEMDNRKNALIEEYGQRISLALMIGIGGQSSRSDLDSLIQVLKKLVFRGGNAKMWLENALTSDAFPSGRVSPHEKGIFLQSVLALRGNARTKKVATDFWVKAKGTFVG